MVTSRAAKADEVSNVRERIVSNIVNPSDAGSAQLSRQAIVFFTGPVEDCVIEGLDPEVMRNVDVAVMKGRYPPIRAGEHLMMKLNKTNLTS